MIKLDELNEEDSKRYRAMANRAVAGPAIATETMAQLFATVDMLWDSLDILRQRVGDNNEMVWRMRKDIDRLIKKNS